MEHDYIRKWAEEKGIAIDKEQEEKLLEYAGIVHDNNRRFRLAGCRTQEEILHKLIIGSLDPVAGINVPRGTLFADMGTGSGIPGIPIGIMYRDIKGVLIESNRKKAVFVKSVIQRLGIDGLLVVHRRIEDIGRDHEYRGLFSLVFSRALGNVYISLELGAPLLNPNGILFIYSNKQVNDLHPGVMSHAENLGLEPVKHEQRKFVIPGSGLIFIKTGQTGDKFPRRFSVIKREASRFGILL